MHTSILMKSVTILLEVKSVFPGSAIHKNVYGFGTDSLHIILSKFFIITLLSHDHVNKNS